MGRFRSAALIFAAGVWLVACGGESGSGDGDNNAENNANNAENNANNAENSANNAENNTENNSNNAENNAENNAAPSEVPPFAAVVSDFATSRLVWIEPGTDPQVVEEYSGDTTVTTVGAGEGAVLDRGAGVVQLFTFAADGLELGDEVVLGAGANPYDVHRAADGSLVIAQYGRAGLLVVPAAGGDAVEIDLTGLTADTDGVPDMAALVDLGGGMLGVVLQGLENFAPVGDGVIAVVNEATWTHDAGAAITLPGQNPIFAAETPDGAIVVSLVGAFGAADGVLVAVDPATGSVEPLLSEEDIGGDILGALPLGGGWLVVVGTPAFTTHIAFVEADGSVEVLLEGEGFDHGAPAFDSTGTFILVPDAATGVLAFDVSTLDGGFIESIVVTGDLPTRGVVAP